MRAGWIVAGAIALTTAGCTGDGGPGRPVPIEGDSISYETGPCFGRCPVYAVTVRPDGSGVFTGKRFTAVTGERAFRLTPEQYRAFAAKIAPYRPGNGEKRYSPGEPGCEHAATDMPSVDVTWTRAIGDSQHLYYYYGCRMGDGENPMANALGQAPDLLPIEELIGPRP